VTLGRGTSSLDHAPDDVAPPYSIMEHPPLAAFVNGTCWPNFLSGVSVNLAQGCHINLFLESFGVPFLSSDICIFQ